MHVVEYDVDNTPNIAAGRLQLTRRIRGNRCADSKSNTKRQRGRSAEKISQSMHRSLSCGRRRSSSTNCTIAADGANKALMLLRGNDEAVTTHSINATSLTPAPQMSAGTSGSSRPGRGNAASNVCGKPSPSELI